MDDNTRPAFGYATWDTLTSADWRSAAHWWLDHLEEAEQHGVSRHDIADAVRTLETKAQKSEARTATTDGTPHAIETEYAGCRFRSRLEARWASFFDAIGWIWEYEPWDGEHYIPDFLIHGPRPLLIEVKPDADTLQLSKYVDRLDKALAGHWTGDVLIVGCSPVLPATNSADKPAGVLGQYMTPLVEHADGTEQNGWCWASAEWTACGHCGQIAVYHSEQSYACRPCGHYDGDHYLTGHPDELTHIWRTASNAVQWKP